MNLLEMQIKKKEEEVQSLQARLKKKKQELKELEAKLEEEKEKERAEFNARIVKEMEQRFGKFTEERLEEFLKNLDVIPPAEEGAFTDFFSDGNTDP